MHTTWEVLKWRKVIIAIFKNKANSRRNGTSLSSQKAKLSEKHIVSRSEEHPVRALNLRRKDFTFDQSFSIGYAYLTTTAFPVL